MRRNCCRRLIVVDRKRTSSEPARASAANVLDGRWNLGRVGVGSTAPQLGIKSPLDSADHSRTVFRVSICCHEESSEHEENGACPNAVGEEGLTRVLSFEEDSVLR